jgi:hypothetical protein
MAKLCDEGENWAANALFKGVARGSLYLGLYVSPTSEPAESAVLTDLTEPSTGGYARVLLSDGDWTVVGAVATHIQKSMAASGAAWGNVYGYFICSVASGAAGILHAVEQFSDGPYNVPDGGSVKVTPKMTVS